MTISKASVDWLSAYKIGAWQYYASLKPPLMGAGLRPLLSSSTVTRRDSWQVTYHIHQFWSAVINPRWEDHFQLAKLICWTHRLLKAVRNSDRSPHCLKVAQWEGRGAGRTRKTASVGLCFAYTANKYHNQTSTIIG